MSCIPSVMYSVFVDTLVISCLMSCFVVFRSFFILIRFPRCFHLPHPLTLVFPVYIVLVFHLCAVGHCRWYVWFPSMSLFLVFSMSFIKLFLRLDPLFCLLIDTSVTQNNMQHGTLCHTNCIKHYILSVCTVT